MFAWNADRWKEICNPKICKKIQSFEKCLNLLTDLTKPNSQSKSRHTKKKLPSMLDLANNVKKQQPKNFLTTTISQKLFPSEICHVRKTWLFIENFSWSLKLLSNHDYWDVVLSTLTTVLKSSNNNSCLIVCILHNHHGARIFLTRVEIHKTS